MARGDFDGITILPAGVTADESAYRDGYTRLMREVAWARERGWAPTERQIVAGLMRTMKVYTAARGGKFVSGQHPEWLRGRADALRELLRQGVGATPTNGGDA